LLGGLPISKPLSNNQGLLAAISVHQMFDLTGAPDRVQADFFVAAFDGTQAPQRIIQAVAVEDLHDAYWIVVGFSFVQGAQ
jgi:hypothetical protein